MVESEIAGTEESTTETGICIVVRVIRIIRVIRVIRVISVIRVVQGYAGLRRVTQVI